MQAICLYCKKEFKVPNYFKKAGRGKYCSRECYWKSLKGKSQPQLNRKEIREKFGKTRLGHLVSKETREKIKNSLRNGKFIKCPICEKEFYVNPSMIKRGRKYCSEECAVEAKRGKTLPLWQRIKISKKLRGRKINHRTPLRKRIRMSFNWKIWRERIFERDNYTCQDCGIKGKKGLGRRVKLEAHHRFETFSKLLDKYDIKSVEDADNCKELWDIDNGITLCKDCHKKVHKKNVISMEAYPGICKLQTQKL